MYLKKLSKNINFNSKIVKAKINEVKGSSPNSLDDIILISTDTIFGTIGGGNLEYLVINEARKLITSDDFIEIYCKASLEKCESRDVKGLYKRARAGEIKNYTGIDSPYEIPENPELIIDTDKQNLEDSVSTILKFLEINGIIK